MCVENKMTNNGPKWAPHGLKFQYRTHICPFWALCPDSAHMGPICPCLLGRNHKLRKAFSKFYRRHFDLVSKYNVGLKTLFLQGLSESKFYGDLVYEFRKIIGKNDFPYHFKKLTVRYKKIGYNI